MKAKLILLGLLLFFAAPLYAQHTSGLAWTISVDDTTANCVVSASCTQTVYRASGACTASSTFNVLSSISSSATTYTDLTITPGTWCYAVSFTLNGSESAKDTVTVSLPPSSPSNLHSTGTT